MLSKNSEEMSQNVGHDGEKACHDASDSLGMAV